MFVAFIIGILLGRYLIQKKMKDICGKKILWLEQEKKNYSVRASEYEAKREDKEPYTEMWNYYTDEILRSKAMVDALKCEIDKLKEVVKEVCD